MLYGKYHDYKIAKFGCSLDDGCIAVVDKGCDRIGPFQLCEKKRLKENTKPAICNHPHLNDKGRKIPHLANSYIFGDISMIVHYTTKKLYSQYSISNV